MARVDGPFQVGMFFLGHVLDAVGQGEGLILGDFMLNAMLNAMPFYVIQG